MQTLRTPAVSQLLEELFADAARADDALMTRLRAMPDDQRSALLADYHQFYGAAAAQAYLPVSREAGTLLYQLARARDARTIVEFGTSFGISTIYLAAALRDAGGGRLITSELEPGKAARAQANLERAGLADLVEVRVGDALETLSPRTVPAIDLLYLDGAKSLYRPVLAALEPRLAARAVIVADNVDMAPAATFTDYVRNPDNGYVSNRVVLGEALEVCLRVSALTGSAATSSDA